jgi:hypothetical protein
MIKDKTELLCAHLTQKPREVTKYQNKRYCKETLCTNMKLAFSAQCTFLSVPKTVKQN